MAQFSCGACGHSDHFFEFRTGDTDVPAEDDDELECPECGSSLVSED